MSRITNGGPINSGTRARQNHTPKGGEKKDPRDRKLEDQGAQVKKAIDGFIFGLSADPTQFTITATQGVGTTDVANPVTGNTSKVAYPTFKDLAIHRKNPIQHMVTNPDVWSSVWKRYKQAFFQGKMTIDPRQEKKATFAGLHDKGQFKDIFKDEAIEGLKKSPQGQRLIEELETLKDMFVADVKNAWVSDDYTRLVVPVLTALIGGAVVVGSIDAIERAKNDRAAGIVASMIPSKLLKVGDFQIGTDKVEWKPSEGDWEVSTYAESDWQTWENFKFKGRLDLFASDETYQSREKVGGKVTASVSYRLGSTYIDSVDADVTLLPAGNYEAAVRAVKEVKLGGEQVNVYIGLEHKGGFGEPLPSGRTNAVAGFGIPLGGK